MRLSPSSSTSSICGSDSQSLKEPGMYKIQDENVVPCAVGEFEDRCRCPIRERPPDPPVVLPCKQ